LGKWKIKGFCSIFANPKLFLTMIFLVSIVCVLRYIVGTSYANTNSRMTLLSTAVKRNIKHLGASGHSGEWLTIRMCVTAYCPCPKCCGRYSDGVTACGHRMRPGDSFVAADKKYPFGTEMIIPGYKNDQPVKVLDRGGAICGNRLDVFFNSHKEALEWGVRNLDVKVRHSRKVD
jgi:3D (Asp-Asp-Asp) domain-containing protein